MISLHPDRRHEPAGPRRVLFGANRKLAFCACPDCDGVAAASCARKDVASLSCCLVADCGETIEKNREVDTCRW